MLEHDDDDDDDVFFFDLLFYALRRRDDLVVLSKYTGPPKEPVTGYDCECGCDERVLEINVGDAAMCVEATCKQKEAFCAKAKAVEPKYVDCMCDCCRRSQSPNLVHNL